MSNGRRYLISDIVFFMHVAGTVHKNRGIHFLVSIIYVRRKVTDKIL